MRSWARVGAVGLAAAVACRFNPSNGTTGVDGAIDAPGSAADAGLCVDASVECADPNTLRMCAAAGDQAVDTSCPWGCSTANGAHCAALLPSGGAAVGSDLDGSGLLDVILANATIDTVGGGIDPGIRPGGMPDMIKNGIDWSQRVNGISVFRFGNLTINGTLEFKAPGDNSMPYPGVVLVASGSITVNGAIDAEGQCNAQSGGPGGFVGGVNGSDAAGSGGGSGGGQNDSTRGGGGGGYGSNGGAGGMGGSNPAAAGGGYFGDGVVTLLIGGGGGGAGGNGGVPHGGGGGGAIQLVANGTITINQSGSINAGGCNGKSGTQNQDSGGGGGAGGTILLEAHDIMITGQLAVNGAGGGAGSTTINGDQGTSGALGRTQAAGSPNGAAAGGSGGAANLLGGSPGAGGGTYGGGGGGSVGRIRINTRSGSAAVDDTRLSPALNDNPTTCSQGSAATE